MTETNQNIPQVGPFITLLDHQHQSDVGFSSPHQQQQQEGITVATYAVKRLADLGIAHCLGVPGDFNFPIATAVLDEPRIQWICSANELNAAYSADGYARACGAAMLVTTLGVGELSAINAIMGAKAERNIIFHLVGAPSSRLARMKRRMHHTLGNGSVTEWIPLSASACCVSAELNPDNAVAEMERVIKAALQARQPAYIYIPQDFAHMTIVDEPITGVKLNKVPPCRRSIPSELHAAVAAIIERLKTAKNVVALPSFTLARYGLADKVSEFLLATKIPFATTTLDKTVISEAHPNFVGMYKGKGSTGSALQIVQEADLVLDIGGVVFDDISTGFATTKLSKDKLITIDTFDVNLPGRSGQVQYNDRSFSPVWMGDVIDALMKEISTFGFSLPDNLTKPTLMAEVGGASEFITYGSMACRVENFLQAGDAFFIDSGNSSLFMAGMTLPDGANFYNQTLWASIGWATPAAFGYALAKPDRRVICVTGDGAHQMTAQEIGVMGRYEVNPIFLIVNNGLYGVEEYLERNKLAYYNTIAHWRYSLLPQVLGCSNWNCKTVVTNRELEAALKTARESNQACYIEVMIGGDLLDPMRSSMIELAYQINPPERASS